MIHGQQNWFLALGLAIVLTPVSGAMFSAIHPAQFRDGYQALEQEITDTLNPGKLLRWAEEVSSLPENLAQLSARKTLSPETQLSLASYNNYLSAEMHLHHALYFERALPDSYTVVQYKIGRCGQVSDVQILGDHTTASPDVAREAVETVYATGDLESLPNDIPSVTVTELFWDGRSIGSPNSLERSLSLLPDGRKIVLNTTP
ncbi:MAG: hypothetical protein H7Y37_17875 [Anaerolineae bacterium]|nr:hypothetical protein [Gloeobacterales cyanobacterium ES-bin-313]